MTGMVDQCSVHRLRLRGGGDAAAQARALTAMLAPSLSRYHGDALQLLAGELVANAVTHGEAGPGDHVELEIDLGGTTVRVTVTDAGPGFGVTGLAPSHDGRSGLYLLDALATRWGIVRADGRTRVWFELALDERPAAAAEAYSPPSGSS